MTSKPPSVYWPSYLHWQGECQTSYLNITSAFCIIPDLDDTFMTRVSCQRQLQINPRSQGRDPHSTTEERRMKCMQREAAHLICPGSDLDTDRLLTHWSMWNLNQILDHSQANLMINGWGISCEISIRLLSLDLTDDKSTLVQVMAWCRQVTSHYLNQCWPRSWIPYGITRPQRANILRQRHRLAHDIFKYILLYEYCIILIQINWNNGLAPNRRKAIILTNGGLGH